jgi:Asp-tRNA(Asn)/Glu-tRNA(Gln) amidotransferase A subunit family amidase
MSELENLSAVELLARYRSKSLSPVDYFAWLERHIAAWEPQLNALYLYRPEAARAEAKASAERWNKGAPGVRSTVCP